MLELARGAVRTAASLLIGPAVALRLPRLSTVASENATALLKLGLSPLVLLRVALPALQELNG